MLPAEVLSDKPLIAALGGHLRNSKPLLGRADMPAMNPVSTLTPQAVGTTHDIIQTK